MRALIDTCVVIDALNNREPFAGNAKAIFLLRANQKFKGFITAKSVTDIFYLIHRKTHDNEMTKTAIARLLRLFALLDTTGLDCRRALSSLTSDYEDSVMIETAQRSDMDCIVTRNVKDYKKSPVTIYTPSEFIQKIHEEDDEVSSE